MLKLTRGVVPVLLTATIAGLALMPLPAGASSHREAPLISQDPTADNTDVYAYRNPHNPSNVVLVANYIGLEQPASGPNFHRFGDDVLYQIHIDNVGDGRSHIAFSFNFQTHNLNDPFGNDTFLYNFGAIKRTSTLASVPGTNPYSGWLRPQTYSVTMSKQGGENVDENTDGGESGFRQGGLYTAPDAVGLTSTGKAGKYNHDLTTAATYNVGPGSAIKVFAGQRDDPFFANLGGIFDFLTINPVDPNGGQDYLAGLNVHSIVLEVPASMLTHGSDPVLGVWATASRRSDSELHRNGTKTSSGDWVQISRLGNPLVNEVVIGQSHKDLFNASQPRNDSQFVSRFTNPVLTAYIDALFGQTASTTGRDDLVKVLLQGNAAFGNKPAEGSTLADELRLNTTTASGWPNGRTLTDDVVATALKAFDGLTCPLASGPCTAGSAATLLVDGVPHDADNPTPATSFPYLNDPTLP